ncbi:extracellular solute-binding protein [Cohnella sp. CFH 77786]|nr:extracellular solute-binding protein [Cohnella sp. CFH 77786]
MKKTRSVLIAAMLVVSLLAACSGGNNADQRASEPAKAGEPSASPTPPAKTADPVTLKFYHPYNDADASGMEQVIAGFERQNPDIRVEMVPLVPGNSVESLVKLDVALASGEQADIVFMPSVEETMARAALGVLAPLDDLYAAAGIRPEEEYYLNPKYDGKYYGVMNTTTNWMVLLNEDALKEAGLTAPTFGWTWDDFRDYAKKMTKGEGPNKRYGTYFHNWGEYANMIVFTDRKNPFLTEELKPQFDDPSYKPFFEMRRAMESEDHSAKPYADVIGAKLNYRTEFFTGKAAMLITANFALTSVGDQKNYPHAFKTVVAPLPRSSPNVEPGLTHIGGTYLAIPAESKHREQAFKFIRYATTDNKDRIWLSGWKKADSNALVDRIYGQDAALLDLASLKSTLYDERVRTSVSPDIAVPYANQLKKVLEDGFSKFILDNITVEEAQKRMMEEADKIIKQNAK